MTIHGGGMLDQRSRLLSTSSFTFLFLFLLLMSVLKLMTIINWRCLPPPQNLTTNPCLPSSLHSLIRSLHLHHLLFSLCSVKEVMSTVDRTYYYHAFLYIHILMRRCLLLRKLWYIVSRSDENSKVMYSERLSSLTTTIFQGCREDYRGFQGCFSS